MQTSIGILFVLSVLVMVGCENQPGKTSKGPVTSPPPATTNSHEEHEHAHPSHGPHDGELIELGNEEYHAELLHGPSSVTIYILDSAGKKAVPIAAKELMINLKHDGKPEQFKLAASPAAGDSAGTSSRFISQDAELAQDLDHEGADAKLVVEISGKAYRGNVAHEHDHDHGDAHGHEHN